MIRSLHVDLRKRLKGFISLAFKNIRVKNGNRIDIDSCENLFNADKILPSSGKAESNPKRYLEKIIGENPVGRFTVDRLQSYIESRYVHDESALLASLSDLLEGPGIGHVADLIISELESLPWKYTSFFGLNDDLSNSLAPLIARNGNTLDLSSQISLVLADASLVERYRFSQSDDDLMSIAKLLANYLTGPGVEEGKVYVQFTNLGYMAPFSSTQTLTDIVSELKSLYGLCMAHFAFHEGRPPSTRLPLGSGPVEKRLLCFRNKESSNDWILSYDLDNNLYKLLDRMHIREPSPRLAFEEHVLRQIKFAFCDLPAARRLRLCAGWFLDSHASDNDLLAYVQATVALEILFGDKKVTDVIGISKLLANRCAYLVGANITEREEILNDFSMMYNVRSKIVHEGQSQMNADERRLFHKLKWVCHRAIQKELEIIRKEF